VDKEIIEVGKVSGSEDVYIRVPFSDHDYYIYIEPSGRIWGQVCKKVVVNPWSDCDDGIDLTTKDVYEMLIKAFK